MSEMICPKAKECGIDCECPEHQVPHELINAGCKHDCFMMVNSKCIPYIPEQPKKPTCQYRGECPYDANENCGECKLPDAIRYKPQRLNDAEFYCYRLGRRGRDPRNCSLKL